MKKYRLNISTVEMLFRLNILACQSKTFYKYYESSLWLIF